MSALELLGKLYRLGVGLTIDSDMLRAHASRGIITSELRALMLEHKAAIIDLLGDGEFPDETLPVVATDPARVSNDVESIRACIEAQRVRRAA